MDLPLAGYLLRFSNQGPEFGEVRYIEAAARSFRVDLLNELGVGGPILT